VVLIGIGLMSLRKAMTHRVHFHEHLHDGERHAHFHLHSSEERKRHTPKHRHGHAPVGIGVLHGLAGGSHLIAVLPALLLPGRGGPVAYVIGYGFGSIVSMGCFSWLMGRLIHGWVGRYARGYSVVLTVFAFLAIGVGIVWFRS
jgi:hypothetical protein